MLLSAKIETLISAERVILDYMLLVLYTKHVLKISLFETVSGILFGCSLESP